MLLSALLREAYSLPGVVTPGISGKPSGDGKTRWVGLSGAVASLVVVVPHVTRLGTGRRVRALLNDPSVWQGDAGLAGSRDFADAAGPVCGDVTTDFQPLQTRRSTNA